MLKPIEKGVVDGIHHFLKTGIKPGWLTEEYIYEYVAHVGELRNILYPPDPTLVEEYVWEKLFSALFPAYFQITNNTESDKNVYPTARMILCGCLDEDDTIFDIVLNPLGKARIIFMDPKLNDLFGFNGDYHGAILHLIKIYQEKHPVVEAPDASIAFDPEFWKKQQEQSDIALGQWDKLFTELFPDFFGFVDTTETKVDVGHPQALRVYSGFWGGNKGMTLILNPGNSATVFASDSSWGAAAEPYEVIYKSLIDKYELLHPIVSSPPKDLGAPYSC